MFTFSIVKKIGEGSYLDEGRFILERIRRERALNMHYIKFDRKKHKSSTSRKNGKSKSS